MGACCDKEGPPSNDIPDNDVGLSQLNTLPPFSVIQSRDDVRYDPNAVLVSCYNIGNSVVYVFSSPKPNPRPNTFWVKPGVIEVLCELPGVDLSIINRQVEFFQQANSAQVVNQVVTNHIVSQ